MTALPESTAFTDPATTEAGFKSALTALRSYLAGLLGVSGDAPAALSVLRTPFSSLATKTGAYTVVSTDRGRVIDITSGTWTLSLSQASELGDGFNFAVRNSGTGTITVLPYSGNNIDGASGITLAPGQSCILYCTGTTWRTIGRPLDITFYESTDQTYPALGGSLVVSHGLPGVPRMVQLAAKCAVAEGGWSVGDTFQQQFTADGSTIRGPVVTVNSSQVQIRNGSSNHYFPNKSTGAGYLPTLSNWRLVIRAWY